MAGDGWRDGDAWNASKGEDRADDETAKSDAWKDEHGWCTGASGSNEDGRCQCAFDGWSEWRGQGGHRWHGGGTWDQDSLSNYEVPFSRVPEWVPCVERVEGRQNASEVWHRAEVAALHDRLRYLEDRVRRLEQQLQEYEFRSTAGVTDDVGHHGNPIVTCVRACCGRRFEINPMYRHKYCCSCCRNGENGHTRRCESTCLPA